MRDDVATRNTQLIHERQEFESAAAKKVADIQAEEQRLAGIAELRSAEAQRLYAQTAAEEQAIQATQVAEQSLKAKTAAEEQAMEAALIAERSRKAQEQAAEQVQRKLIAQEVALEELEGICRQMEQNVAILSLQRDGLAKPERPVFQTPPVLVRSATRHCGVGDSVHSKPQDDMAGHRRHLYELLCTPSNNINVRNVSASDSDSDDGSVEQLSPSSGTSLRFKNKPPTASVGNDLENDWVTAPEKLLRTNRYRRKAGVHRAISFAGKAL
ncbi:hypothetical protein IL306_009696 [Fusarium sp. DS 682]|nr:hypothetical protein IL306_009696 [Fusarium sp. DS 682]